MLFIAAALLVVHVVGTVGKHFIFHFSSCFFLFSPHATKLLLFIWNLVSHSYRLFLRHQYMRDLNLLFHFYFTARPTYIHYFVAKLLHTNVFKYHKCSYLFTFYIKFCKKKKRCHHFLLNLFCGKNEKSDSMKMFRKFISIFINLVCISHVRSIYSVRFAFGNRLINSRFVIKIPFIFLCHCTSHQIQLWVTICDQKKKPIVELSWVNLN